MPKLHELLAVEMNLETQADKTRTEQMKSFQDKRHLYTEKTITFKPREEGAVAVTEDQKDITTTIKKEIEWLLPILAKSLDASYHVDLANTTAKADLVDEDTDEVILKNVPASSLLRWEHRCKELRDLVLSLPTLDPAKGFSLDKDREPGIYKAREVSKKRTKKEFKFTVMVPATKEHPAQIEKGNEDVPIGDVVEQEWSSFITSGQKAELMNNVDKFTRAVKRARSRANEIDIDVKSNKIGMKLLEYIFKPLQS